MQDKKLHPTPPITQLVDRDFLIGNRVLDPSKKFLPKKILQVTTFNEYGILVDVKYRRPPTKK